MMGLFNKKAKPNTKQIESLIQKYDSLIDIINSSHNVKEVVTSIHNCLDTLSDLIAYSDDDRLHAGYEISHQDLKNYIIHYFKNKESIIQKTIDEAFIDEIDKINEITSKEEKNQHLKEFYLTFIADNAAFLCKSELDYFLDYYNKIEYLAIHCHETIMYDSDGEIIEINPHKELFHTWFGLSEKIKHTTDPMQRLAYCEEALLILDDFVSVCLKEDGILPSILCRDLAPRIYMHYGEWEQAERVIKICIRCDAYNPGNGKSELAYLQKYAKVAEMALDYIKDNPGCLQRNIYKILGVDGEDKKMLMDFLKYSYVLKKEPSGNTNALYVKPYTYSHGFKKKQKDIP